MSVSWSSNPIFLFLLRLLQHFTARSDHRVNYNSARSHFSLTSNKYYCSLAGIVRKHTLTGQSSDPHSIHSTQHHTTTTTTTERDRPKLSTEFLLLNTEIEKHNHCPPRTPSHCFIAAQSLSVESSLSEYRNSRWARNIIETVGTLCPRSDENDEIDRSND